MSEFDSRAVSDEQRLRLFDVAADLIELGHWRLQLETNTLWWSDEVYRVHGYEPGSFTPTVEAAVEAYHPDDQEQVTQALEKSQSTGAPFRFELRIVRPTGEVRYVKSVGLCEENAQGTVTGIYGIFLDQTDIWQKSVALSEEKTRLKMAAEAGGFGIWDYDIATDLLDCDLRMYEMYGLEPGPKLNSRQWSSALFPADAEQTLRKFDNSVKTGAPFSTTFRIKRQDGEIRYIHANASVLYDPISKQPARVVGVNNDVTDWHLLQLRTEQARAEQEQANKMKSEFLANMSHEIRTPLNAIIGFSEMMTKDMLHKKLPDQYRDYAEDINQAGSHLLELVDDVLDISRVEAGKLSIAPTDVLGSEIIYAVLKMNTGHANEKKQSLDYSETPDLMYRVDPKIMHQILQNIISNAIKYSPEDTRISIAQRYGRDGYGIVRVVDQGCGMSKDEQQRVFEPFYQVRDNAYYAAQGGAGLGLPLAKRLLDLSEGSLDLMSEKGKGTTVDIILPLATPLD